MKEKLTLEDLAPYLPYNIEFMKPFTKISNGRLPEIEGDDEYPEILTLKDVELVIKYQFNIVLRPLSDLTKEIEHNGERFIGRDEFSDNQWDTFIDFSGFEEWMPSTKILEYDSVIELIKRHFDVFGLIPQGLAIDINTLE